MDWFRRTLRAFGQDYDISSFYKGQRDGAMAKAQWQRIVSGEVQSRSATDELLLRGVDDSLRPQVWKFFSMYGMDSVPEYDVSLRTKARRRDLDIITVDIPRTFTATIGNAAAGEKMEELRRILEVYSVADGQLSYTQGMNAVASILVLYLPEADAFKTFYCMMNNPAINLKSIYIREFPGLFELGRAFERVVERRYPWVARKMPDGSTGWASIFARCFMSMMVSLAVPMELKLVMFDRVIVSGKRAFLSFQLALIRIFVAELQVTSDLRELFMQLDMKVPVTDYSLVIDAWNREWISEEEFAELLRE